MKGKKSGTYPWQQQQGGGKNGRELTQQEARVAATKAGLFVCDPNTKRGGQALQKAALASASGESAHLEKQAAKEPVEDWDNMTKKQKRAAKKARKKNTAAAETAKEAPKSATPPPQTVDGSSNATAMNVDQAEKDESAVLRAWAVNLNSHFDAIRDPPTQQKDRATPEETLQGLLPKVAAEAEAVKAKQQQLQTLEIAISNAGDDVVKEALQAKAEQLQKYIQEHLPSGSNAEANALRDETALVKVEANLKLTISEREQKVAKRVAAAAESAKKFKAALAEERARLNQLEAQFDQLFTQNQQKWESFNKVITDHNVAVKQLATTRLAEFNKTKTAEVNNEPADPQKVVNAANAGDEAAQKMLTQLNHQIEVDVEELRDFSLAELETAEIPHLAHLWTWSQALLLEDSMCVVTFEQAGVPISTMCELVGRGVWAKFFPVSITTTDVVPYQLRRLINYQLQEIAATLQQEQYQVQRDEGKAAMKKATKVVRAATTKLKAQKGVLKNLKGSGTGSSTSASNSAA